MARLSEIEISHSFFMVVVSTRAQEELNLPKIAVIGNQSAGVSTRVIPRLPDANSVFFFFLLSFCLIGKSSIVEAISGVRFPTAFPDLPD